MRIKLGNTFRKKLTSLALGVRAVAANFQELDEQLDDFLNLNF